MAKRIFIWVAHPRNGSFNAALADSYQAGAEAGGAEVRRMDLADMDFDAKFDGYADAPALEPDLVAWQRAVEWADHVLIVHPIWWGTLPARAKAMLDRALTGGFAYRYLPGPGVKWDKLLAGRSGDALITADAPTWMDTLFYLGSWRRMLRKQIYDFCGIKPRRIVQIGSIKLSDAQRRQRWLDKARAMGASIAGAAAVPSPGAPAPQPA